MTSVWLVYERIPGGFAQAEEEWVIAVCSTEQKAIDRVNRETDEHLGDHVFGYWAKEVDE